MRRQIPGKRRNPLQRGRSGRPAPLFSHRPLIHCPLDFDRVRPNGLMRRGRRRRHVREPSRHVITSSASSSRFSSRSPCGALSRLRSTRFTHAGVQGDAKRYEAYLKGNWQPKGNARELRAEGERVLAAGNDPRAAARAYAQAVVFDANDVQSWTGLARALLAIKPDQGAERYDLPVNASGAALIAYERAQTPAAKAAALWVLHEALKRRSYWRPAIDALKTSLTVAENAQVREAYDALVNEHGFRILEYKVDADIGATAPVHPVLRAPGRRPDRLVAVFHGRRQGPAGRHRRSPPDLPRRPRARQALRGAGARRPAVGRRREAGEDGRARRLCEGPRSVRARHGTRLCVAQPRPAGHPARHRQHRQGQRRGLSHRRPQPGADAAERRLRQADLLLRHQRPEGAHRRARLRRRADGRHRASTRT